MKNSHIKNCKNIYTRVPLFFLLLFLLTCSCAINPVSGKRDFVLMSESKEIAMGRDYHPEILKQFGKYDDSSLQGYVTKVGQRLAVTSHRSDLVYRFTVLDSTQINAFALPGGYIYITRGLLSYLNTEDELAAVLGHEIGHVTARHGVRQQTTSTVTNIGLAAGQILIPELRNKAVTDAYEILGGALLCGYSRKYELEADTLSAEYLKKAGYDPRAIISILKILKNHADFSKKTAASRGEKTHTYRGLFATHPDNDTRIRSIVNTAETFKKKRCNVKKDQFLNMISGLVFGDNFSDGIRRGNKFYHGELGFAIFFPKGWNLKNNPDSIQAIAPGGTAQSKMTIYDINKRISCKEFLTSRLGFKNLRAGKEINPNGLKGYTALGQVNTRNGKRIARVCLIFFNNKAYFLVGAARDVYMQAEIDEAILKTGLSFHPLKDNEKKLAYPLRIKIIRAKSSMSYKKLAQKSSITDHADLYLRLLNNQYPTGEPKPGQLIKVF